jgi:chromosome segregation ATPase
VAKVSLTASNSIYALHNFKHRQGVTGSAALQGSDCLDSPRSDTGSAVTDSSNRSAADSSNGFGTNMMPQEDLLKLRTKYDKLKNDARELKAAYIESQQRIDAMQQAAGTTNASSTTTADSATAGASASSSGQQLQQDVTAQLRQQVHQLELQLLAYQTTAAAAAAASSNSDSSSSSSAVAQLQQQSQQMAAALAEAQQQAQQCKAAENKAVADLQEANRAIQEVYYSIYIYLI